MASASIAPYKNNTTAVTFNLATQSVDGATFIVAGRPIATPYSITVQRKLTASGATGNDRVVVTVRRTETNVTTGKLATASVQVSLSIPKDQSILTEAVMKELVGISASVLNDYAANAATTTNAGKLIEGCDL